MLLFYLFVFYNYYAVKNNKKGAKVMLTEGKADYELSQESDTLATADYIFTPYSNSTFGYVITDMKFTQIGTLL